MHRKNSTFFYTIMSIHSRISAINDLGQFFQFFTSNETNEIVEPSKYEFLKEEFRTVLHQAEIKNPWFTQNNLRYCLEIWSKTLALNNLTHWTQNYEVTQSPKNVGIIMAGNIPLVGFHDLIAVLLSGHNAIIKSSSKDDILMGWVLDYLKSTNENLNAGIEKVDKLDHYDAVIATGSNNTARYFDYYFREVPHIIRKNRTSVGVLDGSETEEELLLLAQDIFRYFGLGCRNITKLYLPKGFNTDRLFEAFYNWKEIINHTKYANNYDYNRAIYLMSGEKFLDNNFVILKESSELYSPIGVVNFVFYSDLEIVKKELEKIENQLQCIVGKSFKVDFGETQKPSLTDYADGIDTMGFLARL